MQADLLEEILGRPRFMRVDGQKLRTGARNLGKLLTQLRELTMADRSRVAINKHQHHRPLAPVPAERDCFAGKRTEREIGRHLA